ncbi:hypothetical protein ACIPX0_41540 [Streptomyces sp. NPDC090075]|uniref:hypothetical protein n=1 Tax=Streptomyces sp. NPDC090075 TaxID=3365937 RepID=UPI0037F9E224
MPLHAVASARLLCPVAAVPLAAPCDRLLAGLGAPALFPDVVVVPMPSARRPW